MAVSVDAQIANEREKFTDRFCGLCIGLPLFLELTNGGLSLPQSHFRMEGIPLHSSMLALALLVTNFKVRTRSLFFVLIFALYFLLSTLQEFSRALLALQSVYFLLFYFIFQSLNQARVKVIGLWATVALLFFAAVHLASIGVSLFTSFFGAIVGAANFWGLIIYQSHLTYPLALIFGLWMSHYYPSELGRYAFIILTIVIVMELILLRRAALAVLFAYLIAYRPKIALLVGVPAILLIGIYSTDLITLLSERSVFSRGNAWQDSMALFLDWKILLFGNGSNNYAHNYFLHTVSTHGILYSGVIFLLLAGILAKFVKQVNYALPSCLIISAIVLLDWNVNANLYQPYYAAMLALALVLVGNECSARKNRIFSSSNHRQNNFVSGG